jgi:hypothetical protein
MTDPARIRQAVYDWVHNDCGQAVKMALQRHHIDRLVERICNPAPKKADFVDAQVLIDALPPDRKAQVEKESKRLIEAETKRQAKKGRPKK